VRACKKPSLSAWAVNRLWWDERPTFDELVEAAGRVGDAQRGAAGPTERSDAERARRRAHQRLVEAATTVLSEHGHASSAATMRRIGTSLEAIAARGPATLDPPPGRLIEDLDPPGFDLLSALATMGSAPPQPRESPAAQETTEGPDPVAEAQESLQRAKQRSIEAARTADAAERHRDEAQADHERITAELREATEALGIARQRADRLEKSQRIAAAVLEERTRAAHDAAATARQATAEQSEAERALVRARRA
jgi:hypothetical protein